MDSGIRTNTFSKKQGSANPVDAYAKLVLQKDHTISTDHFVLDWNLSILAYCDNFSWNGEIKEKEERITNLLLKGSRSVIYYGCE